MARIRLVKGTVAPTKRNAKHYLIPVLTGVNTAAIVILTLKVMGVL